VFFFVAGERDKVAATELDEAENAIIEQ